MFLLISPLSMSLNTCISLSDKMVALLRLPSSDNCPVSVLTIMYLWADRMLWESTGTKPATYSDQKMTEYKLDGGENLNNSQKYLLSSEYWPGKNENVFFFRLVFDKMKKNVVPVNIFRIDLRDELISIYCFPRWN